MAFEFFGVAVGLMNTISAFASPVVKLSCQQYVLDM